jgi:hypothetical protein
VIQIPLEQIYSCDITAVIASAFIKAFTCRKPQD